MKIIIRKNNELYIKRDIIACYCDFCGDNNTRAFESEFTDNPTSLGKIEMQICYSCVKQLHALIPKMK